MRTSNVSRSLSALLVGITALLIEPTSGAGQQFGTGCDLVSWRVQTTDNFGGFAVTWIGAPFLACPDGTRIQADSAVVYEQSGMSELMGRVRIDHPERTLRANFVDYFEREERLFATGSVEFRDLVSGNEITGDTLQLLEAGAFRPEQEVIVFGAPGRALIAPPPEEPGEPLGEPYLVTGRRIQFLGERYFRAEGEAVVLRDSLEASADSLITYDEASGNLVLHGSAEVVREGIEMQAPRISLVLPDGELRAVELFGGGRMQTAEQEATGDEIRLLIMNEEVERLTAVRRNDPALDPGRPRPQLTAEELYVEGDSIDILSPGGLIASLSADGNARLETQGRAGSGPEPAPTDSLPGDPVAAEPIGIGPSLRDLPVEDRITGNRIAATFLPAPAPTDSTVIPPSTGPEAEAEYLLDQLIATGNASSWYRSPPEGVEPEGADRRGWAVSYLLADDIAIHMLNGAVDWIEAIGSVRGWQLEAEAAPPRPAEPVTREEE